MVHERSSSYSRDSYKTKRLHSMAVSGSEPLLDQRLRAKNTGKERMLNLILKKGREELREGKVTLLIVDEPEDKWFTSLSVRGIRLFAYCEFNRLNFFCPAGQLDLCHT